LYVNHVQFSWKYFVLTYAAVIVLMTFGVKLEGRNADERSSPETGRFRLLLNRVFRWSVFSKARAETGAEAAGTEATGTTETTETTED